MLDRWSYRCRIFIKLLFKWEQYKHRIQLYYGTYNQSNANVKTYCPIFFFFFFLFQWMSLSNPDPVKLLNFPFFKFWMWLLILFSYPVCKQMTYPWLKNFNAKVTRFQNVEEDLSEGNLIKVIINSSFDQSFVYIYSKPIFCFQKEKKLFAFNFLFHAQLVSYSR